MPVLPPSSTSLSVIIFVLICVAICVGAGTCGFALYFAAKYAKEWMGKRARTLDVETTVTLFVSAPAASNATTVGVARASRQAKARMALRIARECIPSPRFIKHLPPHITAVIAQARFAAERRRLVKRPSPLRFGFTADDLKRQAAAATLKAAFEQMPITLKIGVPSKIPKVDGPKVLGNVALRCHFKQMNEYEVPARFDTSRRRILPGLSPLRMAYSAEDAKRAAAAAALQSAFENMPSTLKIGVPSKIPKVDVPKVLGNVAPRCHLKQLNEYEVPARFDTSRRRILPGLSPLRMVYSAEDAKRAAAAASLRSAFENMPSVRRPSLFLLSIL
ncbi:hypothetical protein R3P38DRAFT_1310778 [Favolaschia claudopus]|uniref:Uncharacterized protein n=1 Tax=Favolaschia claudopus TaxID=2862362 RepID=A0AAW0AVY4_9AGAR